MNTKHLKVGILLAYIVGSLLLLGGISGFYSLYLASQSYETTTAVITKLQKKKEYRSRKVRYNYTIWISYPTQKYGNLSASQTTHNPFQQVGDELTVWYHPERPREIRLPASECWLWTLLTGLGLLCIYGGFYFRTK
ncbi:MAG: DUF3592 domain-containing protein [Parabacteroides sp.]|nr:DUF3592 domain-containing protein [Parabacteroides sp.]